MQTGKVGEPMEAMTELEIRNILITKLAEKRGDNVRLNVLTTPQLIDLLYKRGWDEGRDDITDKIEAGNTVVL